MEEGEKADHENETKEMTRAEKVVAPQASERTTRQVWSHEEWRQWNRSRWGSWGDWKQPVYCWSASTRRVFILAACRSRHGDDSSSFQAGSVDAGGSLAAAMATCWRLEHLELLVVVWRKRRLCRPTFVGRMGRLQVVEKGSPSMGWQHGRGGLEESGECSSRWTGNSSRN